MPEGRVGSQHRRRRPWRRAVPLPPLPRLQLKADWKVDQSQTPLEDVAAEVHAPCGDGEPVG